MSRRTLVFVDRVADAGPPDPATDVVVLDTTWTPAPNDRTDLAPIRPTLDAILLAVDLFDGSLAQLDAWAATERIVDRFVVDGVSWWNRVRIIVRWDAHELTLWRHVVDRLAPVGRYAKVVVPGDRVALAAALRATGQRPELAGAASDQRAIDPADAVPADLATVGATPRRQVGLAGRVARYARRRAKMILYGRRPAFDLLGDPDTRGPELVRRTALLLARVDSLRAESLDVLAIASAQTFQLVRADGGDRFVNPNLAPVLDRLSREGGRVATLAVAIDHRDPVDWARIEPDDRLIPHSIIKRRYGLPEDATAAHPTDGADDAGAPPAFDVAGADLGPALHAIVDGYSGEWLDGQRRWTVLAERFLADLRPKVLFLDREDSRTLWLAAARRLGIPIVTVQHGIIYPNNPAYRHAGPRGRLLPDVTCVYGSYERDVLVGDGAFPPESVIVTGSPRVTEQGSDPGDPTVDRADVRSALGVADGDRMVVVSVANNPVGGDMHSVCMVARMLGGPLPGVHVVIKLHPIDRTTGTYEALLGGLARSGGYTSPPLTVVRDIDLYRLLRAADAHLGQYSTVLTDAVVAGTPSMIAVGAAYDDPVGHVAARVATPVRSIDDVRAFMEDPRPLDPELRTRFLDAHFEPGDAIGRIAAILRSAADHGSVGTGS